MARLREAPRRRALESDLHFLKGSALNLGLRQAWPLCQSGERRAARAHIDASTLPRIQSTLRSVARPNSSPARLSRVMARRPLPALGKRYYPANALNRPGGSRMSAPKKVVLAYSGGLDTSIILKWLQTEYGCEVVTFTADLGQGEELEPARDKAVLLGIKPENIHIEDVREEFVRDFVFPMFRANALYEGLYLLGTSIARPLISKHLVEIAAATRRRCRRPWRDRQGQRSGALRTVGRRARTRRIKVIAPWRMWDLTSRTKLLEFAEAEPDPDRQEQARRGAVLGRRQPAAHLVRGQRAGRPGRRSAGLCLSAHRRRRRRARHARRWSKSPLNKGDAVAINGEAMSPADDPDQAERAGRQAWRRPARPGREPLCRHEVARRLRNPRRHDPAGSASRDRADHAGFGVGPSEGLRSCRAMPS